MFYFIFRIRFTRYKTFDTFIASCNSLRCNPGFIHENVDKFLKFCQLVYRVIEYYLYFIYFVSTKHRNNLLITKFKHFTFYSYFSVLKIIFCQQNISYVIFQSLIYLCTKIYQNKFNSLSVKHKQTYFFS